LRAPLFAANAKQASSRFCRQEKIDDNEKTFVQHIEESVTKAQTLEQEKALENEGEIQEMYLKREEALKKQMKDYKIQAEREIRLYEKKFMLYKNMYTKIKNEKLDLVEYQNMVDGSQKKIFVNPNSLKGLDDSVISEVAYKTEYDTDNNKPSIQDLMKANEQNDTAVLDLTKKNDEANQKLAAENELLKKELEMMKSLKEQNQSLKQEVSQLRTVNDDLSKNVQELNTQVLEKNLEDQGKKDAELVKQIDDLKLDLETQVIQNRALDEMLTETKKRSTSMSAEFTMEMLQMEDKHFKEITESKNQIDHLNAKLLHYETNQDLPNNVILENPKIPVDTMFAKKHERILCDKCLVCPIVGPRFKTMTSNGHDLCEKCYKENNVSEPQFEFRSPCSIAPEKLEDLMPYIRSIFKDIHTGKCAIHFKNGFKDSN